MNEVATTKRGGVSGLLGNIDWLLFIPAIIVYLFGLLTMNSFGDDNRFFDHQVIWGVVGVVIFFVLSLVDFRFLRRTKVLVTLFVITVTILASLFLIGSVFKGARSWFNLGFFAIQPSDPSQLILILILAKYFSRRHIEIANIRHIIVSGIYAFIIFFLVLIQPDFGSAIIIFFIWLGMVLVAGISKKHLLLVFGVGVASFVLLWTSVFANYQKQRIMTFIHPLSDIRGAGYNAYQSTVAVGSGETHGKGIGYGTQSRLGFLPEHETDFIFASFAEENGFLGVVILISLFALIFYRILSNAFYGETNFEVLFGAGIFIFLFCHFIVHIGMNIGLLPVTGKTLPFMSYGGSHLVTEFAGLGILMGMRRYSRRTHREDSKNEFLGI
jgi:rod shape determining protein RodA